MRIAVIGSGAREHALASVIKRSSLGTQLYCYGTHKNPGIYPLTAAYAQGNITDAAAIVLQLKDWQIDFAIIGPEAPLAAGVPDALWAAGIPTIGPKTALAKIETSKAFTRELMQKYTIAGAPRFAVFKELSGINEYLIKLGSGNFVVKANGLMGGKGVKVAGDHLANFQEALAFAKEILASKQQVVIEEKLIGQEFSLMCFSDGETLVPMPSVQDHKRAYDNDLGPNTGGMGSYSDSNHKLPFLTTQDLTAATAIMHAVLKALQTEVNETYIGILYGSFIATGDGVYVIEFNARFGDPEVLNVLSILKTDFVQICQAMLTQKLNSIAIEFAALATVCKYAVPEGYPDAPKKGFAIDTSQVAEKANLYYAAVDSHDQALIATGARTVAYVGIAPTLNAAAQLAEANIAKVQGLLFHRHDIGTQEVVQKRIAAMQRLRNKCYA